MKLLIVLTMFTSIAFAAESETKCPWANQMSRGDNPKASQASVKLEKKEMKSKAARQ